MIDATPAGGTLRVPAGTYRGAIVIDRSIRMIGAGRPLIVAATDASVVEIRAGGTVFEGFDIDGSNRGDLGADSSAVHVAAKNVVVRDCHTRGTLFGVYLRAADGARVERCFIRGIPGKDAGEKGSGIHVWNTEGFTVANNTIVDVRDGFYIQSSYHGAILGNVARDLRYGIHYMYSDDNRFEDNLFANGAAGTAIMYSKRIVFRHNRFIHNRGYASVGLLFKTCDDVTAEENLIADNARGIFIEDTRGSVFRRNIVADSDTAIVLYDSCANNRFEQNSFVGNLTPLTLVGRRTDTNFDGNYWADNREPDLDGDGRSDRPYRLSSVFDHLRGNLTAADLFSQSLAAAALATAEEAFPVLDAVQAEDRAPLAQPPRLEAVPRFRRESTRSNAAGLAASLLAAAAGISVMAGRLRPGRIA